ncbi:hypothetical protein KVG29_08470 [Caldicoprobacter algeriensis]|uniref:hypothetical protein n=1 Tax=Caldicoprobacter algeriensis TaxID=699281 RepID=UPI002079892C|nr:hypothetical protein [Caldicoprobacter algeriensis]MCM8901254.1 hypothetical protein [Caldicoprobacter algeriensis]
MTEMLLSFVEELGKNTSFWQKNSEIGSNNIRKLATMAANASCYKEFKLFMEYKKGKGNGWEKPFSNNKALADVVTEYMDKIYEKCNKDDKEALKEISRFFGYLYWKLRALKR